MLGDWQEKERRFHLSQSLAKAALRIGEGRATRFDLIVINTAGRDEDDIQIIYEDDPIAVLENVVTLTEDDLCEQLEEHRELEKDAESLSFIDAVLSYLHKDTSQNIASHQLTVVREDVEKLLAGKTVSDLTRLERSINAKLSGPGPVDTAYWQGLLESLQRFRRIAMVRECWGVLVGRRKGWLGEKAVIRVRDDLRIDGLTPIIGPEDSLASTPPNSPVTVSPDGLNWDPSPQSFVLWRDEAGRKVHRDEIPFNAEAEDVMTVRSTLAAPPLYKPRFFNRVRTAFDWNKYNQTHYDTDNPPPKTVQGYRFNIFYPLLTTAEGSPSPTYRVDPDPSSPDMRILRFVGGGPYAEVVFRVQAEEWDMSHRHGFKCTFEGGCLRLHFYFKSQRYRR